MTSDWKESAGQSWKPEKEDDSIMGLLVKIEEEAGELKSMVYHLETKEEGVMRVWGTTVLDSRMAPVKVGQEVKITYKGIAEKGGKGKNKPKIFKVEYRDVEVDDMNF